jgi:hypothetical protein
MAFTANLANENINTLGATDVAKTTSHVCSVSSRISKGQGYQGFF